jgi:hypothetical protein
MSGVSREVTEHTLNIKPDSKPIKQGLRCFNQEKRWAMGEELSKLLATGFVKEVQHSDWIVNPFLVPKKNGRWRMCVDYTCLNKACFPPSTNQPGHGPDSWVRTPQFPRCLFGLSPDPSRRGKPARHHIHYSHRMLLLCEDAAWIKECRATYQQCM